MKKVVAFILFILGVVMIFLGYNAQILPPAITGVGFIGIAVVFLQESRQ
jgi:small-conductance mechanosensitive channel